ncbi:MAG: prepilin-type N-terminal cleavage/methylation domain-containing protein [Bacilli bacterium]|nr:prepilin-type N-terminal cleavage/methylation domain-containing protein [Bacilli bacterium]
MKKNGFTLVELLAVIVILGIIIVVSTTAVSSIINNSKNELNNNALKNALDVAITYAEKEKIFISNDCALDKEITESNYKSISYPSGCSEQSVTVQKLIDMGLFNDDSNILKKDGKIIIYKYKHTGKDAITKKDKVFYDIKSFASESLIN